MSLYSPEEREDYARTGERPGHQPVFTGLEGWQGSQRPIRTRLASLAGVIAFVGLLQLLTTAQALATTRITPAVAVVNVVIAAFPLALAVLMFLLYRAQSPAPGLTGAALALAGVRALAGIAIGFLNGRSAFLTILLPVIACGVAMYVIVARYRELSATANRAGA